MRRTERIVYAVHNKITNKSYIGYCVDLKERKARHLKCAKNGVAGHFYNAIRKYGEGNFEWIILFDNLGGIEDCKIMEKRMIGLFDTFNNGYNSTLGGDGGNTFNGTNNSGVFQKGLIPWNTGMKMSKEHCQKLSDAHKGVPLSKERAKNLAISNTGRIVSEETRRKISIGLMNYYKQKYA